MFHGCDNDDQFCPDDNYDHDNHHNDEDHQRDQIIMTIIKTILTKVRSEGGRTALTPIRVSQPPQSSFQWVPSEPSFQSLPSMSPSLTFATTFLDCQQY